MLKVFGMHASVNKQSKKKQISLTVAKVIDKNMSAPQTNSNKSPLLENSKLRITSTTSTDGDNIWISYRKQRIKVYWILLDLHFLIFLMES